MYNRKNTVSKLKQYVIGGLLSVFLLPANFDIKVVQAADNLSLEDSAYELAYFIQLFNQYYVGRDFTIEDLHNAALSGMAELMDDYSEYYSENELDALINNINNVNLGLGISYVINSDETLTIKHITKDSPAYYQGLEVNDIITKINDKKSTSPIASELLLNDEVISLKFDILRNDTAIVINVEKASYTEESVFVYKIDELYKLQSHIPNLDHVRYVEIPTFTTNTGEHFKDAVEKMKTENVEYLVLDLRNNSGGQVESSATVCKAIVPEGPIYTLRDKQGEEYTDYSDLLELPFKNILVLVNGASASAAELVTSAIQDSNAGIVIGTQTYGKGIAQTIESSLNGGGFKYTFSEYFSRNGTTVHGVGITPDIVIDVPDYILEEPEFDSSGSSPVVLQIKGILTYLGYELTDKTSYYDNHTKDCIKNFQKETGLYQSGMPDVTTLSTLNSILADTIITYDFALEKAIEIIISDN